MADHAPEDCEDRDCKLLACKLRYWRDHGLHVDPSATPTRKNRVPPRRPNNAWERGIPTDSRNMPYLDGNGQPMGQKEFVQNRRAIEADRRRAHNAPATPERT